MIALSIVMPAYNEEANITEVLARCANYLRGHGLTGEIIVVNDGSKDQTGAILTQLQQQYAELVVLTNEPNRGYGYSLQRAIQASRGELVATIDSDGQFEVFDLDALRPKLEPSLAAVTGYRIKKQDSLGRVLADRGLNLIMKMMFGLRYRDTNCALKLYRGELVRTITIESMGYPTPTELLVKLTALGHKVGEAPVSHKQRSGGQSALKPLRTGLRMLAFLVYLRLKLCLYRAAIIRAL